MLTTLLVKIKRSFPFLWRSVEDVNSMLVKMRYRDLHSIVDKMIESEHHAGFKWSRIEPDDATSLSDFLTAIPPERLQYFRPHPFDIATLSRMARGCSFLMFKVTDTNDQIAGYHFLRLFFIGKAFHGLIVSEDASGKGIGTRMWALGASICKTLGMKMEATVSETNLPSLASARRACHTTILSHLPGGYLHLSLSEKE